MKTLLKRIIRSGWNAFLRQGGLSVATVFIMVMTVSLVTSLFLFRGIARFSVSQLQEKADISVYFTRESLEQEILAAKEVISKIPEVKTIEYISHQEAVKKLLSRHPELEQSVAETAGILNLASLNIRAEEASQYEAIAKFLEEASFKNIIEKVDYSQRKSIIEKIFSITSTINQTGIILSLILAAIAFFVAFNQVKLAIFNSREEIGVQRLVGASNWFIRGPFLVQGIIFGFCAILITLLISVLLLFFLSPKIETLLLPGFDIFGYFADNFFLIILIQLLVGIGLGIFSSLIAMRKYLQV